MTSSRFIITVIGSDRVGIVARITTVMANYKVNIVDISQTIMQGLSISARLLCRASLP